VAPAERSPQAKEASLHNDFLMLHIEIFSGQLTRVSLPERNTGTKTR